MVIMINHKSVNDINTSVFFLLSQIHKGIGAQRARTHTHIHTHTYTQVDILVDRQTDRQTYHTTPLHMIIKKTYLLMQQYCLSTFKKIKDKPLEA